MTWCLCGYGAIQRASPIKLDASHPTASGQRLVRCCDGFPPLLLLAPPSHPALLSGLGPGWPKRIERRTEEKRLILSPWRYLLVVHWFKKDAEKNTESQHEPLWELGCRLIIHVYSQLRSRYKYARRMRTVYHAGTLRQLIATYIQHLPSRQYQPRWSRGSTSCNPSSHLQPPGGLSCISSPSVPYTWLVHMALSYSKG
jgi:hypothetical protein